LIELTDLFTIHNSYLNMLEILAKKSGLQG